MRLPGKIETERLILRFYERKDIPQLPDLIGNWEVARWLTRAPYPYTMDDGWDWYRITRQIRGGKKGLPLAIISRETGKLVGGTGVGFDDWEVGYWLGERFWGQGYATEAVRALVDWTFETLHPQGLIAHYFPGNLRSARVLEKLGFGAVGETAFKTRQNKELIAPKLALSLEAWETVQEMSRAG